MTETFREVVCGLLPYLRTLAIVDIVILVLLLLSFPFLDPRSGSFVAWGLTLFVVSLTLALYAVLHYSCRNH